MKILVTGACGFIGFHLSKFFLSKNIDIVGIDNLNSYYSVKLKKDRLKNLKKFNNFRFIKIDLENNKRIKKVFQFINLIMYFIWQLRPVLGIQ